MNENIIVKSADISQATLSDEELKLINQFALRPLSTDDVFAFKAVLCDNETDREYERFSLKALKQLAKLFIGRTVIKDHTPSSDNQVARIYKTEIKQFDRTVKNGEPYTQLVAYLYMVKTAGNADLITEINGGIKKEGSVSFSINKRTCSICGKDANRCSHYAGKTYKTKNGEAVCEFILDDIKDAYEFSLVAVPAQRAAGVSKSFKNDNLYKLIKKAQEINEQIRNKAADTL